MADHETDFRPQTASLTIALVDALNATDVALRNVLVLMTRLGYGADDLTRVITVMYALTIVSEAQANRVDLGEVVEGVG